MQKPRFTGILTLLLAGAIVLVPVFFGNELTKEHLMASTILGTIGGLLTDPASFKEIATKAIPWFNSNKE